ncbi:MAG: hypothetical protein HYR96_14885 [Deltaproteobacteria bacterium]|nr:hypothetical protein [Deltaproteobacteria bacterium]MBI3293655.1 hypothetical protein [Deltaproteobacteria bacterium]
MKALSFVSLVVLSQLALGVDLKDATNSQLLGEVERRMGGPATSSAFAIYTCDSSGTIQIELYNAEGATVKQEKYLGSESRCKVQAAPLTKFRSKLNTFMLAAICDSSGSIFKYPLKTDGTFGKITEQYLGNETRCLEQAKLINEN